ncbi:hypothetical protein EVAR_75684_1 [Eumeta japonica]|uniref:Uncharacterized protein n=1 Tax=Eumeta variegata TaxID=151549 RepID=A0A4C1VZX8_EUMVA|nr:hypothetical protein EVAR_75684_1 [Eumeta japonica]
MNNSTGTIIESKNEIGVDSKPFHCGRGSLWPTSLQNKNGPVRPVRYHTLTKNGGEVVDFAITIRPMSESAGGPLPFIALLFLHQSSITNQEAGRALVIPLRLQIPMGGGGTISFLMTLPFVCLSNML